MSELRSTSPYTHDRLDDGSRALMRPARLVATMGTPTARLAQRAGQAWASLSDGWRELRQRAGGALTRLWRGGRVEAAEAAPAFVDSGTSDGGLIGPDIWLDDDRVVVRLEILGMSRDDLHFEVECDRLRVWSGNCADRETRDGGVRSARGACGGFRRDLMLPQPVAGDRASASCRDGVLRIEFPRLHRSRGGPGV